MQDNNSGDDFNSCPSPEQSANEGVANGGVHLQLFDSKQEIVVFLETCKEFLLGHEAMCNLFLAVASATAHVEEEGPLPHIFWSIRSFIGNEIVAVAMMSRRMRSLVLFSDSKLKDDQWRALSDVLAGSTVYMGTIQKLEGQPEECQEFLKAYRWSLAEAASNDEAQRRVAYLRCSQNMASPGADKMLYGPKIVMKMRIFTLQKVLLVPPLAAVAAEGEVLIKQAGEAEEDAVVELCELFRKEAVPHSPPIQRHRVMSEVSNGEFFVLSVAKNIVAMARAARPTATGIAINSVYTRPEWRGRGYASLLVSNVSQMQLDRGFKFCMLFTDLSNPTSNSIYTRIGYRPVGDWIMWELFPGLDSAIH